MKELDLAEIQDALKLMIGHPVWGVRQIIGSFMYFEFGRPHLRIVEPRVPSPNASPLAAKIAKQRKICPEGELHLMLHMCAWRVVLDSIELAHSESTREAIALVADGDISGRIIKSVMIDTVNQTTIFTFENGLTVETWKPIVYSKADSDIHEQWHVANENGDILAFRGDGSFAYFKGNSEPSSVVWSWCGASQILVN